jgi:hypothetical protein
MVIVARIDPCNVCHTGGAKHGALLVYR